MGYDQKQFCHDRGRADRSNGYAASERRKGMTSKFGALQAPATKQNNKIFDFRA